MYPAYQSFGKSIACGYATWRVYMELQPPVLVFTHAKPVKVKALAEQLAMGAQHVRRAIGVLVEHGFLLEQGRGEHGVRMLTLAYALDDRRIA